MHNTSLNASAPDSARGSEGRQGDVEMAPCLNVDEELLSALVERWHRHRKSGAEIRYEIGSMLNSTLGQPTCEPTRDAHHVMHVVAKRFKTTALELYDMRWMAAKFASVEALYRVRLMCRDRSRFNSLLHQLIRDDAVWDADYARRRARSLSCELKQRTGSRG